MYSVQNPTGDAKAGANVSDRRPPKRFWISVVLSLAGLIGIEFTFIEPVQAASNNVIQYQIQRKQQQRFQQQFGRPPIKNNSSVQKPRYMQQFGPPAKTAPTTLPRPAPTGQQFDLSQWNAQQRQRCIAGCNGQFSGPCPFGDANATCMSMNSGGAAACINGCYRSYGVR
jgi:hypothetical protein